MQLFMYMYLLATIRRKGLMKTEGQECLVKAGTLVAFSRPIK